MRTVLAGVATAAIALGGCGDGDTGTTAAQPSATPVAAATATPTARCPDGTKRVTAARLVRDPAPGYSLVASNRAAAKAIVAPLRKAFGRAWRDHDERVLTRDGGSGGTLLLVINSKERTGGNTAVVDGMLASATQRGYKTEPITVRGRRSRLVRTPRSYVTIAGAGRCAVVMVVAKSEKEVRAAVAQMDR